MAQVLDLPKATVTIEGEEIPMQEGQIRLFDMAAEVIEGTTLAFSGSVDLDPSQAALLEPGAVVLCRVTGVVSAWNIATDTKSNQSLKLALRVTGAMVVGSHE